MERLEATFTGPGLLDGPGEGLRDTLAHGLYGVTPTGSWWWLAVKAPHTGTPFDLAHTLGCAMAVIALCLVVGRLAPRFAAVAFGAGAMTLTLYSLHVVLRTPQFWPDDDVPTFALHVAIVLVVGAAYRLVRSAGPLERMTTLLAAAAADRVRSAPDDSVSVSGSRPPSSPT
jgi:hypothetical protein